MLMLLTLIGSLITLKGIIPDKGRLIEGKPNEVFMIEGVQFLFDANRF